MFTKGDFSRHCSWKPICKLTVAYFVLIRIKYCFFRASDHLCISESLNDQALRALISAGLEKHFPNECGNWTRESTAVETQCRKKQDEELRKVKEKLDKEQKSLSAAVHEAVVDKALRSYSYVLQKSFSTALLSIISIDSSRSNRS